MCLIDYFVLKIKFKHHLYHYLYYLINPVLTVLPPFIILLIMKDSIDRPRPFQTVEFEPIATNCSAPFLPAFRINTYPNPCDWKMWSCPSGHTLTACSLFSSLLVLSYNFY